MTCRSLLFLATVSACVAPMDVENERERRHALHDATTVVALTFDDTFADNFQVGDLAEARGMRATFYVNSSRPGTSGYMTMAQLQSLASRGHEIAGHTISHARLTAVSELEARTQVCNDRAALMDAGFTVTSFAYPFGANSTEVNQIVEDCGYNSARDVGGLTEPGACSGCPYANTRPPANAFALRTHDSVNTGTTLAELQDRVLAAERNGGGFVPFVFHHVCNGCNSEAISPATLAAFMDWLEDRAPATQVGTVHEIIGGDVKPVVRIGDDPEPPPATLLQNPSLEIDANSNAVPDCWQRGGFGTNSASFSLVSDAFDGDVAQQITITSYSSGARRLVSAQDGGTCAPAASPGRSYTMSAYYKATTQPRFTVYYRDANGTWTYFAQSPLLPTSSTYRQATYTSPPLPSGATAISMGLGIFGAGTITMDAYTLVDASSPPPEDTTPPTLAIACNGSACSTSTYSSPVQVSLTASDAGSGLREVRYTTDGSDPVNGTLYTGPFTVSASSTIRATAVDNEDNRTSQTAAVNIAAPSDTTPPTLSIACNGSACATTAYDAAVTVTLTANDAGSGLREVRYTTDGSDPVSGTLYTGPFTLAASAEVRATAVDNAGNRTSQSATITIDGDDPPPPVTNMLQNASLEVDANGNQIPDCWNRGGYGTNSATYTLVSDAFDGSVAQRLDITSWSSGGRRLNSMQDAGACAPAATPGRSYTMTGYYKSNVQPRFSVYVRSTSGAWRWFAESAPLPASATYQQATYTSPPLPSDVTHISVGISIFTVGSITTDAYTLVDASAEPPPPPPPPGDTTAPVLDIACNGTTCSTSAYADPVSVSLSASDADSGLLEIRYTLDGSDPTSGTLYTEPFTVSTTSTVRATAVDNADNRSTQSVTITIGDEEPPPPPATNMLQNASLETDANGDQVPDCWFRGGYGTNTSTFTLVNDAFDGSVAQHLEITSWSSGGRRLNSLHDDGACAPTAVPGRTYSMTGYYKSNVQPRFSVYVRSSSGAWRWFAESAPLPASDVYTEASYTSPPLPADTTHISVGLSIFSVGSITTDAYTLIEN